MTRGAKRRTAGASGDGPRGIRPAEPDDLADLVRLRLALWSDADAGEERIAVAAILAGATAMPSALLVAEDGGRCVGFVEVGVRSHADGCDPCDPVGYLEGWYVEPDCRRSGWGRDLVAAAEAWARGRGCRELASDTWLDNEVGQRAHRALGFEEVDRCVHYRRQIAQPRPSPGGPQVLHFDVFGRGVEVRREADAWRVFLTGAEGKRREAESILLPPEAPGSELARHLADLCHEWASPRHPRVRRLDDGD